jgi:pyridoxal phosphate enzyme (YggS family)
VTPTVAVADRVADVRARIARAADVAGRNPGEIRLIAVTKGVGLAAIQEAASAGVTDFGENRVQEAVEKMDALGDGAAGGWSWHLIGRLQSNKVRAAVGRFAVIQSVDSERLGLAIDEAAARVGIIQRVFIQVNVGREPQKGGVAPEDVAAVWQRLTACRRLRLDGLMAIPPATADPEGARSYFRDVRRLGDLVGGCGHGERSIEYSMGMSNDFDVAVQEGATMVRVGTAIFGARTPVGRESERGTGEA